MKNKNFEIITDNYIIYIQYKFIYNHIVEIKFIILLIKNCFFEKLKAIIIKNKISFIYYICFKNSEFIYLFFNQLTPKYIE